MFLNLDSGLRFSDDIAQPPDAVIFVRSRMTDISSCQALTYCTFFCIRAGMNKPSPPVISMA